MSENIALGKDKNWQELTPIINGGLYWVITDHIKNSKILIQQIIQSLPRSSSAALISCGIEPYNLVKGIQEIEISALPFYNIPEKKIALMHLTIDISRSIKVNKRFFLLQISSNVLEDFTPEGFADWISHLKSWLNNNNASFIVISHKLGSNRVEKQLGGAFEQLNGLASIEQSYTGTQFITSWWRNHKKLIKNQVNELRAEKNYWSINENTHILNFSTDLNDELLVFAEQDILEKEAKPKKQWHFVEHKKDLTSYADKFPYATIIISLGSIDDLKSIVEIVFSMRKKHGRKLKIIVREKAEWLRFMDISLLLNSGANLVIPHEISTSKFLMMLETVRGQIYTRRIPDTMNELLIAFYPEHSKGLFNHKDFSRYIYKRIHQDILLENEKGVLIIFNIKSGLDIKQAESMCELHRQGDIKTIFKDKLYLFLSTCSYNDVDYVIKNIFNRSIKELFSSTEIIFRDNDLLDKVMQFNKYLKEPETNQSDKSFTETKNKQTPMSSAKDSMTPKQVKLKLKPRGK